MQIKLAVGHHQCQRCRLGIGEIEGSAAGKRFPVDFDLRTGMGNDRRDGAQVGAPRQIQGDRLVGLVDFAIACHATCGDGEGGDQIIRRTRFDDDTPCGTQCIVFRAVCRIIGGYLIGKNPIGHRACHGVGGQPGSHLYLHCQLGTIHTLRQLHRHRASLGIDAAHRAADGHTVNDRLLDAALLSIGKIFRNDLLIDDPQGSGADLTIAFFSNILLQIFPHELNGLLTAGTPLCLIGVKETVAVHAGLARIQVEVGRAHAQPIAQRAEHIRVGRMVGTDFRPRSVDFIYRKVELMVSIYKQSCHTQQSLCTCFSPSILAGCLRSERVGEKCPSIFRGDMIPNRLREVVGLAHLQICGIVF